LDLLLHTFGSICLLASHTWWNIVISHSSLFFPGYPAWSVLCFTRCLLYICFPRIGDIY
jgi:hypothetical protein